MSDSKGVSITQLAVVFSLPWYPYHWSAPDLPLRTGKIENCSSATAQAKTPAHARPGCDGWGAPGLAGVARPGIPTDSTTQGMWFVASGRVPGLPKRRTLSGLLPDGRGAPGLAGVARPGILPTARLKGCGSWLRAGPKFAKTGQTWGTLGSRLSAHLQSYTSGRNVPTRPTKTRKRCMPSTC